ncbi:MAG: hypothetical protein QW327_02250 [Candidatus Odinarchaeota archaeon]
MKYREQLKLVWEIISKNLREYSQNSRIVLDKSLVNEQIIRFINKALGREDDEKNPINLNDRDVLTRIIIQLIEKNYPIEDLSEALNWVQFEYLCMKIFEYNDFECKIHYCFRDGDKRFEIDILAYRDNLILAADVKHWSARQGKRSLLVKYVEKQDSRTRRLVNSEKFLEDYSHLPVKSLIPLVITWYDENIQFHERVPIIPIYKLNNFLNTFEQYDLKTYSIINSRVVENG